MVHPETGINGGRQYRCASALSVRLNDFFKTGRPGRGTAEDNAPWDLFVTARRMDNLLINRGSSPAGC
eukprot:3011549-Pyramimonas_sp.AAC.1